MNIYLNASKVRFVDQLLTGCLQNHGVLYFGCGSQNSFTDFNIYGLHNW